MAWGRAPVLWRSSRQSISALNTAEAELTAAAMAWQVVSGFRALLEEWGVKIACVHLMLDNDAAITITEHGPTWRTRYFDVRAARIREEMVAGRLRIGHEPTTTMVADGLTKLASADTMSNLRKGMLSEFPPSVLNPLPTAMAAHRSSVSCGPQNRGDIAGDGPAPAVPQHEQDRRTGIWQNILTSWSSQKNPNLGRYEEIKTSTTT